MGFLKRLFGGEKGEKPYVDERGIYFYIQCDNCGSLVRVRADKEYDLIREESGFVWHKTIVDSNCFRRMPTVVRLDGNYRPTSQEIEGGRYLTREEYESLQKPTVTQPTDETRSYG